MLNQIKQSFRFLMNGQASRSMREKGLEYHLNWGVALPQLQEMAKGYGKDLQLAIDLWKEDIRECKIMATFIMPVEKMSRDLVDLWMEQTRSQEIAEIAVYNVYAKLDFAPSLAFEWIAEERPLYQLCGYHILSALFKQGMEPNERGINELIDQVQVTLKESDLSVKHAAMNCMNHFAGLNDEYEIIVRQAIPNMF